MSKCMREFYAQDTLTVAQSLIGHYLVRVMDGVLLVCRITETEAYIGRLDKACHAYGYRRTKRTDILFGPPGYAYIYFIYGLYHCLNFVTEAEGEPCAVLIRGGEPRGCGMEFIARNRFGVPQAELTAHQQKNLLNGPGKLCLGLDLTRRENGLDLTGRTLFVCQRMEDIGLTSPPADDRPFAVERSKRIGIGYAEEAVDFPWRFSLKK